MPGGPPLHRFRDQGLAQPGQTLQTRREIYRVAGDGVLPMGIAAGTAGHHLTAGDANMEAKRPAAHRNRVRQLDPVRRLVDRQGRAHRPLRIVVMGHRGAEDRHDIVTHMLVDGAAEFLDDAVGGLEIAVEDLVGGLGAQPLGHAGVIGDIGEEHRHLAALALRGRLRGDRRLRLGCVQLRDSLEKPLAISKPRNTKVLQVFIVEFQQQ